ncbi:O-antigen ligase family protein [Planococcus shenhongbingii]|uniref:O-antigen ligase family protein n=1 Tax=Planococcus shenhongbingii TaxID=3058398 RepID=A0ABT8NA06_9BACL|nr:O-antigen ligase family protein [Planococcus sp. N017]MDN7244713.1 O-antigen ligase family protein [Planococcus sp. N017]
MNFLKNENEKWFWLVSLLAFMLIGYTGIPLIGYVLTILLFAYAFYNPKNGILMLFVYIPIRVFIIEYNPGLSYITDALVFGALFKVFWMNRKTISNLFKFKNFEYAFFAFLAIGSVAALITGVNIVNIIQQLRSFTIFYLVYYIVYRLQISRKDLVNLIWIFIWTSILILIQAMAEKLSIRNLFLPESWQAMALSAKNRVRIYGMLGNPNVLGIYLLFAFILFYTAKKKLSEFNPRHMDILNIFIAGILVLTYSRGTWGGFLVAAIAFVLLTRKWKIGLDFVKYLAIALVFVVLPLNLLTNYIESTDIGSEKVNNIQQFDVGGESGFADRIGSTFSEETVAGSQNSGRIYIVKKGFEVFSDYPIIGTGFATFGDSTTLSSSSPIYRAYEISHNFYSDNQYIQIIVQTGILGVIAFAVFLLSILWRYFKKHKESYLYVLTVSILLGGYFMGLVYNLWESDIFTLSFFALLAAASRREDLGKPIGEKL